ncbi:hypothetical protein [Aquimarina algiphila]|uniref:hypothetical protein n=1 Tax=Aquimarina algiphila TaxID=2047982 RepID=UPI00232FB64D|nr:hypothetical protein [Aquimarina algiphila]
MKYKMKLRRKGLFWMFPNNEYQKKEGKLYYKKLIKDKVLFGNPEDINRLEILEEDVDNNNIKPTTSYLLQSIKKKGCQLLLYFLEST